MNWKELLAEDVEQTYKATESLMDMVDDANLGWKPATGSNWMTTGQLLMHLTSACGQPFKGFITGDWGLPPGVEAGKMSPEEMVPPAEKLSSVGGVSEAKRLLHEDKQLALQMLASTADHDLATKAAPAPWDPRPMLLGRRLLEMVQHLKQHKGQLFYYLKLQGKPVHTGHLWGM